MTNSIPKDTSLQAKRDEFYKRIKLNEDSVITARPKSCPTGTTVIAVALFDSLVEYSINLLETKGLLEINDEQHVTIMRITNTLGLCSSELGDSGTHHKTLYSLFEATIEAKRYMINIIKVYPEWVPNRGMGYYFPKLKMEIYGTPQLESTYCIVH